MKHDRSAHSCELDASNRSHAVRGTHHMLAIPQASGVCVCG